MEGMPVGSSMIMYGVIALLGVYFVLLWPWQLRVLRGKCVAKPDGSVDDWHVQKTHFGIAVADVFVAAPVGLLAVVLAFLGSKWGFYLLALSCSYFLWASLMSTANSLRFEKPRKGFTWFMTFPFGAILSLVYLVWTFIYYDILICR
jgi:hypothetical protein